MGAVSDADDCRGSTAVVAVAFPIVWERKRLMADLRTGGVF
jgi:hypothetical protein